MSKANRSAIIVNIMVMTIVGTIQAQSAFRHAVVITELYPDPDAVSGLKAPEFVELKNVSGKVVDLKGWKLTDGNTTAIISGSVLVKPDSFLLIGPASSIATIRAFGAAIGLTGFPSLNNDEDKLSLIDAGGSLVHHLRYDLSWYNNEVKSRGGWTLEIVDPLNACGGRDNWKASEDIKGGTPGGVNSVNASNPDTQYPAALKTYLKDSLTIMLVFDETMDSSSTAIISNYRFEQPGLNVLHAMPVGPAFDEVVLTLNTVFRPETVYEMIVTGVKDCSGNGIGSINKVLTGMPSAPAKGDLIINELLFNPRGNGYDYVELYNRSKKIINLKEIMFASPSNTGTLTNIISITDEDRLLFPGEYIVATENAVWLNQNYQVRDARAISQVSDLPSLADDKGTLTVMDKRGLMIDEITYSEKWHFALLNNLDGVAMERINFSEITNDKSNWTSAASAASFGTPGYQNSQYRSDLQAQGSFVIDPKIFSPDNDGYEDVALFKYEMAAPGFMGSVTIYDASGRPVRYLVKSALLGIKGSYTWDGLDEKQTRLSMGVYIVLMEVFDLNGRVKKIKNTITLARKF